MLILAEFFKIDDLYILCTKPLTCVLFKQHKPKPCEFEDLESAIMPIFPQERSITLKSYSIRMTQVPMCLGFCLTDYKVQGETLPIAILDIKHNSTSKGKNPHKRFCSTYVQLSRLPSLEGLHLLQRIEMKDLQFGPDHQLLAEMQRLEELQRDTIAAWVG